MNDKPCLVEHMALPASKLRLLATYPGSARTGSLTLTWFGQECGGELWCGSGVYSVVIGASNAYGTSVYAIVDSARVCWQCTY